MFNQQRPNISRISPLSIIIMLVVVLIIIYLVLRGLMAFASWAMPVLLVATLFIDYKVYLRYIQYISDLYKRSIGFGVLATLFTLFFFPFVVLLLFSQAIIGRWVEKKVKENPIFQEQQRQREQRKSEYIDYEEVEDVDVSEEQKIELPPVKEAERKPKDDNRYDDFF